MPTKAFNMLATVLLGLLLPLGNAVPTPRPAADDISGPAVQVLGFDAMERNLEADGYHYDVYVNSDLTLTCMVTFSGKDVSLEWTFPQTLDQHEINPISFADTGNDRTAVRILKINNARIEDSGPYTCFARREGQNEALANTTYIHFIENGKQLNHMNSKKNQTTAITTPKTTPTTPTTTTPTTTIPTTTTPKATTTTTPKTTTTIPTTTTTMPTTTTTQPTTTTPAPTTTTTLPTTTTTTLPTTTTTPTTTTLPTTTSTLPTTTTRPPTTTTTLPTTTTTLPTTTTAAPTTTTEAPTTTTPEPTTEVPTTTPAPTPAPHHFDWISFLAGIMLVIIIVVIALVIHWIFKKMKERSFAYQTL